MQRRAFWLFTGPSVVLMLVLMVFPVAFAMQLSLNRVLLRDLRTWTFVGLENYREVLADPEFWSAFGFTLQYVVTTVPLQMLLGLGIALLLDRIGRGRSVYLAALLMPFIVTPVVGTLLYRDLFTRGGLLAFLAELVTGEAFVVTAGNVRVLIMVHAVWFTTPFAMIVYLAGLQTLPQERLEAAAIDGASFWQSLRNVVLPHLRSLTIFIALISVMDAYRTFDNVFVFAGSRFSEAHTLQVYNFYVALSNEIGRVGKGHAIAMLNVVGIFVVLVPFLVRTWREQLAER